MKAPVGLCHTPVVEREDYDLCDGMYAGATDARALSVGKAQWDGNVISAKVWRHDGSRWSRQSEELPLHRVVDLNILMLKSVLESAGVAYPATGSGCTVVGDGRNLPGVVGFYKSNKQYLLPKLRELKIMLDYFLQEEPKF